MPKLAPMFFAALAVTSLVAGCSVESSSAEDTALNEGAVCANPEGTNAMIAALAASVGRELHRWQASTDLQVVTGAQNQQVVQLTATGKAQCTQDGGQCKNTVALLSFQDPATDLTVRFPGGIKLSAWSYAARLVAGVRAQKTCDDRGGTGINNCYAEAHKLTQLSQAAGGCSMIFQYSATTPTGGALKQPKLIANKLVWAGYDVANPSQSNPFLLFNSTANTVEIDPQGGPNEGDPTGTASCMALGVPAPGQAACLKYSPDVNLLGTCCQCDSKNGTFARSPRSTTSYTCTVQ
jgi:hypothetical protein